MWMVSRHSHWLEHHTDGLFSYGAAWFSVVVKDFRLKDEDKDKDLMSKGEWVSSVLRPHQHSINYTGDGFYRSKDPTNSIKVLKVVKEDTKYKENN